MESTKTAAATSVPSRPSIQDIIEGQSVEKASGASEEDIIKSLSPLIPNFPAIIKIAQALGTILGLKSRYQCVKQHNCPYEKAVLSYFLALKQMELEIKTLYDTNTGSTLEAKLPNDIFTLGGRLKIEINDAGSQVRIHAITEVKGQLFDWGKGSRLLNELCESANQYIQTIHISD